MSRRLPAPPVAGLPMPGFPGARLTVEQADDSLKRAADRLALPRSGWARQPFDMLAISGGAAGGAWGAGLLVGLTRSGRRPNFALVTGVSTGALIAPFAFLGPEWDARLTDAYTGGHAARLFRLSRLTRNFGPSLFQSESLEALIGPFVDEAMLAAIAVEHARGRRLLVATTDLDSQRTCVWDMGAIATRGDAEAVRLFREVLMASSSLPGLFPPRLFQVEQDDTVYEEMHIDGGVSAPLFLLPEALLRSHGVGRRLRGGRVHVLVNTVLEQAPRTTAENIAAVLMRSFDTMLRFSYRQALAATAAFCSGQDLPLSVASIPDWPGGGHMMSFDTRAMRRIFNRGLADGEGAEPWTTSEARPLAWSRLIDALSPGP